MALTNKPKFENEDDNVATETAAPSKSEKVETATATPPAKTAPATALATQGVAPVTAVSVAKSGVLASLKDQIRVDFDSLPSMGLKGGKFMFRDAETVKLGDAIKMELNSYQEQWVVSPGDNDADIELVKYSDDGITTTDGYDCAAHLADLKAQGFTKAKIAHRVILVGELVALTNDGKVIEHERVGDLVQVNLPDTGRRSFNSHCIQAAYAVGKGRKTAEEARMIQIKSISTTSRNGDDYFKMEVSAG